MTNPFPPAPAMSVGDHIRSERNRGINAANQLLMNLGFPIQIVECAAVVDGRAFLITAEGEDGYRIHSTVLAGLFFPHAIAHSAAFAFLMNRSPSFAERIAGTTEHIDAPFYDEDGDELVDDDEPVIGSEGIEEATEEQKDAAWELLQAKQRGKRLN